MLCNVYIREQNQHLKALGINSESPLFFVNLNSQQIEQLKTISEPGEFEIYLINEDPYMRDLSNKWVNRGNVAPEVKIVERVVELPPKIIEKTIEVPVETIVEVEVVKEVVKNVFINPNTGEVMSETDVANIKAKANPIEADQWEGTSDDEVLEEDNLEVPSMVSVGVVGDAVTVEDGDLVYPDVEESTVGLDIDVLPVPDAELAVEELDVTEEPKEEVKPVDEVVTEEPVLFDWDKWEPKLSKEETDILLNKVVSSDFNPSTDVLFKLSSSGPKEIDDYLHDNFLYLLEDSPKPELVEEVKEEPKEEAKPVDDFDEVPSEDEIIIDTKVSFEEWKKDPKNIKPKKKKAKKVKVEKDPEPELEFEEVKDIPVEPKVKPDPFANEVIQDEVVVELTEEEAELYKDVEVEAEE